MGLAQSCANRALSVANHYYGAESESSATFDNLGGSVDCYHPVLEFWFLYFSGIQWSILIKSY
jgi:hypothetical protein